MLTVIFLLCVTILVVVLRQGTRRQRAMNNRTWQYLRDNYGAAFDALCCTTATMLKVPLCELNIVGEHEQFHLGKYPSSGPRTDPASASGCQFVIKRGEVIALDDCTSDEDFAQLPGVQNGHFSSYLGVPLYHRGEVVGSFCVGDTKERVWTEEEITTLRAFAKCLGLQLSLEDSLT